MRLPPLPALIPAVPSHPVKPQTPPSTNPIPSPHSHSESSPSRLLPLDSDLLNKRPPPHSLPPERRLRKRTWGHRGRGGMTPQRHAREPRVPSRSVRSISLACFARRFRTPLRGGHLYLSLSIRPHRPDTPAPHGTHLQRRRLLHTPLRLVRTVVAAAYPRVLLLPGSESEHPPRGEASRARCGTLRPS